MGKEATVGYSRAVALLGGMALAAWPAAAEDFTVTQKDKMFSPAQLTIRSGDTLVFVNADTVKHNVHSATEGFVFDLPVQQPGRSDRVRFTRTGVVEVLCHIHPRMTLTVRVTP
jgi:plastocyanin